MIATKLSGYHGNCVEFSPFDKDVVACSAGQNFGLKGNGALFLLHNDGGSLRITQRWIAQDTLYAVCWSESNPNTLVSGCGDGSIAVWTCSNTEKPQALIHGHDKEVCCLHWNQTRSSDDFLSGSWDGTIKLWNSSLVCLRSFSAQSGIVHCVRWSPHLPGIFACTSGNAVRTWDARSPDAGAIQCVATEAECISADWTYYDQNTLVSSSVDSIIRVWDLRSPLKPIVSLSGHGFPAKQVKCSPHRQHVIASASYDFTTRIWDYTQPHNHVALKHRKEFTTSVAFNIHHAGQLVDTGWDQGVCVFFA